MNFQSSVRYIFLLGAPVAVLLAIYLAGCVRVAGTAGYWRTGSEGETTAKQAGFDTADTIPGSAMPGKITI